MTIKTTQTQASVADFINEFAATPQKKQDGFALLELMKAHTGYEPKMWGPSIIGLGGVNSNCHHHKFLNLFA